MNRHRLLDEALSSLREEHKSIRPPSSLDMRMAQLTTRGVYAPRLVRWQRVWIPAVAVLLLAFCVAGILYMNLGQHPESKIQARIPTIPLGAREPSPQDSEGTPLQAEMSTPHRRTEKRSLIASAANENGGRFVALPSSEGLPAPSMTILVRMRIRRDDLRQYGLEISPTNTPEIVLAEFVVGQDGLSRAVRFVR